MKHKKLILVILGMVVGFLFLKFGGLFLLMKGFLFLLKWSLILFVFVWLAIVAFRLIGKPLLIMIGIGFLVAFLGMI